LIMEAGKEFDLALIGMRAMDSLRIEKSYRMWGQDLTTEYSPFEASMERFVRLDKPDFVGREALLRQQEDGVPHRFVTLACEVDDADPLGNEPLYLGNAMVGRATAGAYGHHVDKALALGYVSPEAAQVGTTLAIEILNKRYPATVIEESPYDPENKSLRA
ncbi:MAG: dimethylglycine dehydrogenase, partial [Gammaproteobacteria bacterium]|nr:dimethylglycine dehydrogenase [Gammaproteobacteria bacterium]